LYLFCDRAAGGCLPGLVFLFSFSFGLLSKAAIMSPMIGNLRPNAKSNGNIFLKEANNDEVIQTMNLGKAAVKHRLIVS
jgi:hypothetical protein